MRIFINYIKWITILKNEWIDFVNNDIGTNYTNDTFNKLENVIATNWVKYIPDGTKKDASNFYLSQLINEIDNLKRIIGNDSLNKVHLFLEYAGLSKDISAPWYTGDFDKTEADIILGIKGFYSYLID